MTTEEGYHCALPPYMCIATLHVHCHLTCSKDKQCITLYISGGKFQKVILKQGKEPLTAAL